MISRRATLFLLLLGVVLSGCTDPTSIDPAVSEETWTPAIETEFSNYRRVGVNFLDGPSPEIERNVVRIEVQSRRADQGDFAPLDTLDKRYDRCCYSYTSDPVLAEDADYELRMKVQHQKGGTTTSNSISFTSPVVKGERLDTIATTSVEGFTVTEDNIYAVEGYLREQNLTRIRRATEERTVLIKDFNPPTNNPDDDYERVSVHGDTLLAAANLRYRGDLLLTMVDLQTQEVVKSERISPPTDGDDVRGHLIHNHGANAHVFWLTETPPIQVLDISTGEVVRSYPHLFSQTFERLYYDFYPFEIVYDGSQYWITGTVVFNRENRLVSMDPSSGTVGAIHQIPIFRPSGLAWDGEHFWVYDDKIGALVKFKGNGI